MYMLAIMNIVSFDNQKYKTNTALILVHKTYSSQKHWLTFSATPSFWGEVRVLNIWGSKIYFQTGHMHNLLLLTS